MIKKYLALTLIALALTISLIGCTQINPSSNNQTVLKFNSDSELIKAFEEAKKSPRSYGSFLEGAVLKTTAQALDNSPSVAYSTTNIQVAGVDEADIIKTDGKYIYTLANQKLIIAQAYPADKAEILSQTKLEQSSPQELFIDQDKLLIFGYTQSYYQPQSSSTKMYLPEYMPYYSLVSLKLFDISDKKNPKLVKNLEIEGNYLTSRKINNNVYFVVNSYPHYLTNPKCGEIVPLYREDNDTLKPIAKCTDIGYIKPIQAENFITLVSFSMKNGEWNKEIIVGSGQNVYASLNNLYVVQTTWPSYNSIGKLASNYTEKTVITKFSLNQEKIEFKGTGEVKGTILNQFSMDEYNDNFRIATTINSYSNNKDTSTNNLYVLDNNLVEIGKIEGIAPGESIYSVRFMGKRAYMVTFRHIDPLFVIDLAEPKKPAILGKLKIPGYSDYLHPYDETHLIGIGKEVDASIDADKVHTEGAVYYTAIQGVKISLFDVSDVNKPIEMYKEVIGDRGTESLATSDHKAFLFDQNKNLLVIPLTVAELKSGQAKNEQGEYTFQGAYVYNLNLNSGFKLQGKVTHYDSNESFQKSGYYFYGDYSIKRSLYIDNVLYTLSDNRLQINHLNNLSTIKKLELT